MIMLRTLNQDLRRYNDVEISDETQQEESGWKLIHAVWLDVFFPHFLSVFPHFCCVNVGQTLPHLNVATDFQEVFRPPNRAGSFAVLVGTGAQVNLFEFGLPLLGFIVILRKCTMPPSSNLVTGARNDHLDLDLRRPGLLITC